MTASSKITSTIFLRVHVFNVHVFGEHKRSYLYMYFFMKGNFKNL